MSFEALHFIKTLEPNDSGDKLLLYAIAELTFPDSGFCRVGQKVLMHATGMSESTLRRHMRSLEKKKMILCHRVNRESGGRMPDKIELLNFLEWNSKIQPVKMTGGQEAHRSTVTGGNRSLMTGTYKEERTSKLVQEKASNSHFEEKKEAPARPAITVTRDKNPGAFAQWVAFLKDTNANELAKDAEAIGVLVAASRYPTAQSPLPKVDRPRARKARKQAEAA